MQEYFITYTRTDYPVACKAGSDCDREIVELQMEKTCFRSSCMDKGCTGGGPCNYHDCHYHPFECTNEDCPEAKRVIHSRCSIGSLTPEGREAFEELTGIKNEADYALYADGEIDRRTVLKEIEHDDLVEVYKTEASKVNAWDLPDPPEYVKRIEEYRAKADKIRAKTPTPKPAFPRYYATLCQSVYSFGEIVGCNRSTTEIGDLSHVELDAFLKSSGYDWYIETLPETPPEDTLFLLIRKVKKEELSEALKIKQEIERGGDCYHLENLRDIANSVRGLRNNPLVERETPDLFIKSTPKVIKSEPITIEPFHFSAAATPHGGPGIVPTKIVGEDVRFDKSHVHLKDIVEDDWDTPSPDAVHVATHIREGQDKTHEVLVSNNEVAVSTNEAVVDIGKTLKEIASHITQEKIQKDETATQDTVKKSPKEIITENRYQLACEGKGWADIVDIESPGLGGKQRTSERNAIQRAVERFAQKNKLPTPWKEPDTPKEPDNTMEDTLKKDCFLF